MLFRAFLAVVINYEFLTKEQSRPLDIFKIITDAAGGKWNSLLVQKIGEHSLRNGRSHFAMELQINLQTFEAYHCFMWLSY